MPDLNAPIGHPSQSRAGTYGGTPAGPPPQGNGGNTTRPGRTVPVKWVAAGVGVLLVLGLTFYGGMAYENHRIRSEIEEAFSGFDDTSVEDDVAEDAVEEAEAPEPQELIEGTPVEVETYDGTMTVTLQGTELTDQAAADDTLTRNLAYTLKVENTGDSSAYPSLSAHFETESGQVMEFAGVFCDEDSLPSDEIGPGQFVEGCESSDLPNDAGRLVFEDLSPGLFITVPAA